MSGLGSFIDGFVGGADVRNRWDDRKRQRKLDDEDRVYLEEQRSNGRNDRAYTLEERQRQRVREDKEQAERDRVAQEDADERRAAADAYAAANGGATDPNAASEVAPAQGRSLDIGAGGATGLTFGAGVAPVSLAPIAPTAPPQLALPGMVGRGLPGPSATMTGQQPIGGPPMVVQPGPTADQWNAMTGAERDAYQPTMGPAQPALPPDPGRPQASLTPPRPNVGQPSTTNQTTNPNLLGLSAGFQGALAKGRSLGSTPGDTAGSVAAVLPSPGTSPAAAAAASDPAAAAANPAASPAVQIAAATAPQAVAPKGRLAFGIDTPVTVTPKQAAAATDSFMQNYLDKGVPKMVDYYLKTGQVEKAQAFADWAETGQNKESMRLWAEGVHAAAIGDETKMLDSFGAYYNRFDNGEEIVRAKSGITRDGNGNMTGATITFKDTKTGVEHTQTFEGTEDLLQAGVLALSPEKMFEMMHDQQKAADQVEASSVEFEQSMALALAKAGVSGSKPTSARVAAIWADLSKNSLGQFDKLPLAERSRQVAEIIAGQDQTAGAVDGAGSTNDLPNDYSD